jgi:hypothetical protein
MDATQLALFPDDALTGTGKPRPWPVAKAEPEAASETPIDPNQIAFGEEEAA